MQFCRLSSLKVASSLLILAFFYDIFWVFISSSIFGKNVMVTVATGLNVPIKILVCHRRCLERSSDGKFRCRS